MKCKPPNTIIVATDERGDYLVVADSNGRTFLADVEDRGIVESRRWSVWKSRSEYCMYAACRKSEGGLDLFHREVMRPDKGMVVDHIDGVTTNNRRYNMRVLTVRENHMRKHRPTTPRADPTLPRGVYATYNGKFVSVIKIDQKMRYLGTFVDAVDAARAWNAASKEARGDLAILNNL